MRPAPRIRTAPRPAPDTVLTFVCAGDIRVVDLRAPMPMRRGGQWVVSLMDLWVATMLPHDVLDLSFRLVVSGPRAAPLRELEPMAGLDFARGYVSVATRETWWDDAITLRGLRVERVIASAYCSEGEGVDAPPESGAVPGGQTSTLHAPSVTAQCAQAIDPSLQRRQWCGSIPVQRTGGALALLDGPTRAALDASVAAGVASERAWQASSDDARSAHAPEHDRVRRMAHRMLMRT